MDILILVLLSELVTFGMFVREVKTNFLQPPTERGYLIPKRFWATIAVTFVLTTQQSGIFQKLLLGETF